jgi:hypothetical protein
MTSSYGQIRGGGELLEASPVAHAWARVQRGGQFAHPRRMRAGDSLTPSKLRLGRFDRAGFSFFFPRLVYSQKQSSFGAGLHCHVQDRTCTDEFFVF